MSRFGDLIRGQGAPAPEPVVEEVLITPEEEVLTEASPLEEMTKKELEALGRTMGCLLYTSPSPRDAHESRMPSSA